MKITINAKSIIATAAIVAVVGGGDYLMDKVKYKKQNTEIKNLQSQIEALNFKTLEDKESLKYKDIEYIAGMFKQTFAEKSRLETFVQQTDFIKFEITDELIDWNIPLFKNNFKSGIKFSQEGQFQYKVFVDLSKAYLNIYADGTIEIVLPNDSIETEHFLIKKQNEKFEQDFFAGVKDSIKKEATSEIHGQWEKAFKKEGDKLVKADLKKNEKKILSETQSKVQAFAEGLVKAANQDANVIVTIPALGK